MKKSDAIAEYGNGNRLAVALGISRQAIHMWGDYVPADRVPRIMALREARRLAAEAQRQEDIAVLQRLLDEMKGGEGAIMKHPEMDIHRAVLRLLALTLPRGAICHHSPNEIDMAGPAAARQVAKARSLGTVGGWPDLQVLHGGRLYALEIKSPAGRQSPAQIDVQRRIEAAGGLYAVVRSVDECAAVLSRWGLMRCLPEAAKGLRKGGRESV